MRSATTRRRLLTTTAPTPRRSDNERARPDAPETVECEQTEVRCRHCRATCTHTIPVGAHVRFSRNQNRVAMPGEYVVSRHDRGGNYRLHDRTTDTYVTACASEVTELA